MPMNTIQSCLLLVTLLPAASLAAEKTKARPSASSTELLWPGEEMPLQLSVRSPDDLTFKEAAERMYLLFNLLASGKLAFDRGDMASAATKWEMLLRVPNVPADLVRVVQPLAIEARRRAGGVADLPSPPAPSASTRAVAPEPAPVTPRIIEQGNIVRGVVTGGGSLGPGGTVVWLQRTDGPTPRPHPSHGKTVMQRGKKFLPRVLAVPVGSTVNFRNDDVVYHNVFSLSRPNEFDLGLYRQGISRTKTFNSPGPVSLLCNIHSSMSAYLYVVDSPYYTQADQRGNFTIRGVPSGSYTVHAWHETSLQPTETHVTVNNDTSLALTVISDRPTPAFVPDKAGKPRQSQLGY